MPGTYSKYWCFTVNNPTADDGALLTEDLVEYLVMGRETGENGTSHIQGFVILNKRYRIAGLSKLLPRGHLEAMKGTPQQASDYCKKDGDFMEIGILPDAPNVKGGSSNAQRYVDALASAKAGTYSCSLALANER